MQDMQKQVEAEGAAEKKLFDAYMCYCKEGTAGLDASIATAAAQIDATTSAIASEKAEKAQLEMDVTQHKADRTAAEAAIKESTAMREKEAAEFAASSGEMTSNLEAMKG